MRNITKPASAQTTSTPRGSFITTSLGKRGAVAALVGLSAPVLVMAVALSAELTGWTVTEIRLQRTADMAATAGALAYVSGASIQLSATQAAYIAEINGASGSTTRTWNSGTNTLSDNMITVAKVNGIRSTGDVAFRVTVQQTVPRLFSALVLSGTSRTITATATGEVLSTTVTSQIGAYCILALGNATGTGVSLSNGVTIDTSQCGVQDNAAGSAALQVIGGATLKATTLSVSGGISQNNGGTLTVTGTTTQNATTPGVNPYANVAIPTPGSCAAQNSFTNGSSVTISPGTFCNGLTIQGYSAAQTTITMNPGVYIINEGNFSLQNATLNGTGVTIVLTGTSSANIGSAQVSNGTVVNLTAPTSGPTSGIAIMQNSLASSSSSNASSFQGGSTMNIVGALDLPGSIVDFSNGTSNTASCTQLIAYQVVFLGGSKFGNNCSGTGTSGIGAPTSTTFTASLVQ